MTAVTMHHFSGLAAPFVRSKGTVSGGVFIDIIDEEEIPIKWKDFIHTHHYQYTKDFYSSYLGLFPRRSCEMVFAMFCLNVWADNTKGFRQDMSWSDLEDQIYNLICEEQDTPKGKNYPIHYAASDF